MAYLQHNGWKERPGAVIGVIAVHAAIGYALVTGLSFKQIVETVRNPQAVDVVVPIEPPPPPKPEPTASAEVKRVSPPVNAPIPRVDVSPTRPPVETTPLILPPIDILPKFVPGPTPSPSATASRPAFDPQPPQPRNSPGSWVTQSDYRTSWINRELTGTARFRLEIAANGRVENCTITASSGHSELDTATCDLVSKRARFTAARNASGTLVPGSYSSSVRWELPE